MATTAIGIAAALTTLFSPPTAVELFVLGLVALVTCGVVLLATLVSYFGLVLLSNRTRGESFDELRFVPFLILIATSFMSAVSQFFAAALGAAASALSLVVSNPRRIISLILISSFIALYLLEYQLQYPIRTAAWNCFLGPIIRPLVLPLTSVTAFLTSLSLPFSNFVSQFLKTATASAALRAIISAFTSVIEAVQAVAIAAYLFGAALGAWVSLPTPSGQAGQLMLQAPDFAPVGAALGLAAEKITLIGSASCSPLTPYIWQPLAAPFTGPHFIAAVNNTLALPYVLVFQGLFRPIAQFSINRFNNPGGSFADHVSPPSFNSTIDTLNEAQRGWVRFLDQFVPELVDAFNTLLRDVTGLPLPTTSFPQRGFATLLGGLVDIGLRAVKLTQNLFFSMLFEPSVAFSYPDGIRLWKFDELADGVDEYVSVITDFPVFIAEYLEALGDAFQIELTAVLPSSISVYLPANDAYTTLSTEGDAVAAAFDFVANLVTRVPCIITSLISAVRYLVLMLNDLLIGTIYAFLNTAFGGNVPSPFTHAQTMYAGMPYANLACKFNNVTIFTASVVRNADDEAIFEAACDCPITTGNLFVPYILAAPVPPDWRIAGSGTLGIAAANCTASRQFIWRADNSVLTFPLATNRFYETILRFGAPLECVFELISDLCLGDTCPFAAVTATDLVRAVADLLILPINVLVHTDKIATDYFLRPGLFPLQNAPRSVAEIVRALTNALRRILRAVVPAPGICPDANASGVGNGGFVICCFLNIIDGGVGLTTEVLAEVISQVQTIFQADLDNDTSQTLNAFVFREQWVSVIGNGIVCVPLAAIPLSLTCSGGSPNLHATMNDALGFILTDGLLIIPRMAVGAFNSILSLIITPSANGVVALISSVVLPIVEAVGNVFIKLADVFGCLDSANPLSNPLVLIGQFISNTVQNFITTLVELAVAIGQFVVGIFQVFTGGSAHLLFAAAGDLLQAGIGVVIAVVGQGTVCGLTDALCVILPDEALTVLITPCLAGTGANNTTPYDFGTCSLRKRSVIFETDCFDVVQALGFDRAGALVGRGNLTDDEQLAADCYGQVTTPRAIFDAIAMRRTMDKSIFRFISQVPERVMQHWHDVGIDVRLQGDALYAQQLEVGAVAPEPATPEPIDFALFSRAFSAKLAGENDNPALVEFTARRQQAKRSVGAPWSASFLVNLAAVSRHVADVYTFVARRTPAEHVQRVSHAKRSEPVADPTPAALVLGFNLVVARFKLGAAHAADRIDAWLGARPTRVKRNAGESSAIAAARLIDEGLLSASIRYTQTRWSMSTVSSAIALDVSTDVLPVFGLPECDSDTQVCTNCLYLDDLILVSTSSYDAANAFYSNAGRGSFSALVDDFEATIVDVFGEPLGSDTYTTAPRARPFITERLWNIRWAWQWDYTEFIDTINTPVACNTTGDPLDSLEIDEGFKDIFRSLFGSLIPLARDAICRATVAPAETATRLLEAYWTCDYGDTLYCVSGGTDSDDDAQRLIDGMANSLLIVVLVGLFVEMLPGGTIMIMFLAPLIMFYGTFWIGFGASPACTTPSMIVPIGAYPVCAPMALNQLLIELLNPPPFPIPLIDPAARAEYSEILVAECGVPPPVINCEPYGFAGIYDNIFFTTGVLLGDSFNSAAASTLAILSADAAASATLFTEDYIAELEADNNAGDICNRETFLRALFGILALAGKLVAGLGALTNVVPFLAFVGIVVAATLMIVLEAATQLDRHWTGSMN